MPDVAAKLPLSACVITRDEAANLPACLETLAFCDDVVVVDSGSADETVALARAARARVLERDWPGMIAQKNRAADAARHDWVLSVDADERVSPRLEAAIREVFARPESERRPGYEMAWETWALGGPVRSDRGRARWKLRLFDRRRGRWEGREPHGHVRVDGPTARLGGPLRHHTYRDLSHHVQKIDAYTEAAAEAFHEEGRGTTFGLLVRPPAAFLRTYVLRGGFRDGVRGLVIAAMTAAYVFLKYAKLWERTYGVSADFIPFPGDRRRPGGGPTPPPAGGP